MTPSRPQQEMVRSLLWTALPFVTLVIVHLLSNRQMEQPIIMADELGYLGNARFLAGRAHLPDLRGTQFYHFGYSLLITPAFWVFANPLSAYQAVLTLNALLMSALFFPLRSILLEILELPRRPATGIAMACCLYPPLLLLSSFAWAENALVPAFALALLLFARFLETGSMRHAVLLCATAGFLYTIHPRALPVIVAAALCLLLSAAMRSVRARPVLVGLTILALIFLGTRLVNQTLQAAAWAGGGEFSAIQLASRVLPGAKAVPLILRSAGQALYLALASHGLFLVGVLAALLALLPVSGDQSLRRRFADPKSGLCLLLLLSAAGIFLASTTTKLHSLFGPQGVRVADFVHGRYNEVFAVVFIALGLALLHRRGVRGRQALWGALAVTLPIVVWTVLVRCQVLAAQGAVAPDHPWIVDPVNIAGIFPAIDLLGVSELPLISLIGIAAFLLIGIALRLSWTAGLSLFVLLFCATSLYNDRFALRPAVEGQRARLAFLSEVAVLEPIRSVAYDVANLDPDAFFGSQFQLQNAVFERFNSRNGEVPSAEVVISGNYWYQAERLGARFAISAADGQHALWVLPGDVQSRLVIPDRTGLTLGVEPVFGVHEYGWHQQEWFAGEPARWTAGAARLRVPIDRENPPRWLEVEIAETGRRDVELQIVVNDVEVWNGWIPEAWSTSFELREIPLGDVVTLELNSDTFQPRQTVAGSTDDRDLGVLVKALRLQTPVGRDAASLLGRNLGAAPVTGVQESGFHPVERFAQVQARWTNGAAKLTVPIDPATPPEALELEVSAPGRSSVRLRVLANGIELWQREISDRTSSVTLELAKVPMGDSLLIELDSDAFVPARSLADSTDSRTLGVVVESLRLTVSTPSGTPVR